MCATSLKQRFAATARVCLTPGGTASLCAAAFLAWCGFFLNENELAAQPKVVEIPMAQPLPLVTKDGVTVQITYYKSTAGKESPVIVLLHMKDGNRFVWQNGFAERLQKEGYAVITVDLRGHGESKGGTASLPGGNVNQAPNKKKPAGKAPPAPAKKGPRPVEELGVGDYKAMVTGDLEAVKVFIKEQHQAESLNMNKMALVGPEMGATIAAEWALIDWNKPPYTDAPAGSGLATPKGQDVRAIVLISPQKQFPPGMDIAVPIRSLSAPALGVAFLVAVGKNDPQDKGEAHKLFEKLTSFPKSEERMHFLELGAKLRGTELMGKGLKLEENMLVFFDTHLRKLPPNWRDRRSKFDREPAK